MHLEQHVDDLGAAVETGRRRLAAVDLGDVLDSALADVRAAGPERWRPKHRSRWPVVAGVLVLGAAACAFIYLVPTLRRATEGRFGSARPEPVSYPATPWSSTSEEANDGEETGF